MPEKLERMEKVSLSEICINPTFNARSRSGFKGKSFDELVASIEIQGVIQPILIRVITSETHLFEVVAGERRYRAAKLAGLEMIPAMIRVLTDKAAHEIMLIENADREDITGIDEARSIKRYMDLFGDSTVTMVAEKINKSDGYVRKRLRYMGLPEEILTYWEKGQLNTSHLDEIIRFPEEDYDRCLELIVDRINGNRYSRTFSAKTLREYLMDDELDLAIAAFDAKTECRQCKNNTDVQKNLFEIDKLEDALCLDQKCFIAKQKAALWEQLQVDERFPEIQTNGIICMNIDIEWEEAQDKNLGRMEEDSLGDCKKCDAFVSVLYLSGQIRNKRLCNGDGACYNDVLEWHNEVVANKEAANQTENGTLSTTKTVTVEPAVKKAAERAARHGEEFREIFFADAIPEKIGALAPDGLAAAHLSLIAIITTSNHLNSWFCDAINLESHRLNHSALIDAVSILTKEEVEKLMLGASTEIIMNISDMQPYGRHAIADYIEIDLQTEWTMTDEYLEKKQIKELLHIGKQFGVFEHKNVKTYMDKTLGKAGKGVEDCKKTELIRLFTKTDIDLAGMVPKEILKAA